MTEVVIFRQRDPLVIEPGELHNFITIETASTVPDTFGQSVSPAAWNVVGQVWAALYTAGGRETSQAAQIVSEVSHVIKIRYSSAFKPRANYRVIYGERYFTVQYVENVKERNRVLLLYALEVNSGGS
jgi:SPP1 family predicted phage head-tail adaptor